MTTTPHRVVLLAADDAAIEQVKSVSMPTLETIVLCWSAPTPDAAAALGSATVIDLSTLRAPVGERIMRATGILALSRLMQRSSPGRLLDSLGPAHRSRLFSARVRASGAYHPRAGDAVIALDLPAAREAWLTQHRAEHVTATLGLGPGLNRVTKAPQ